MTKFCVDCRHYKLYSFNYHVCERNITVEYDLVTKQANQYGSKYCHDERNSVSTDRCGKKGKFWEQKKIEESISETEEVEETKENPFKSIVKRFWFI